MEIQWSTGDMVIKEIYWSTNFTLEDVEERRDSCDILRLWYPEKIDNWIYKRYGDVLTYIEYNGKWKGKAYSAIVDLTLDKDSIINHFSKTRRYEIRRALERDNLVVRFYRPVTETECKEFISFYNAFAKSKLLSNIGVEKVYALMKEGMLVVAEVRSAENEILSMHGYITDRESRRVALYTSSSLFREKRELANLIGRANGLLHYQSMLHFKDVGYDIYDFGGIYKGDDNIQLKNITQYKMSLGGKLVEFDSSVIIPFYITKKIDIFLKNNFGLLSKSNVIIWGAGCKGKYLLNRIRDLEIIVSCIIDNKLSDESDIYVKDDILEKYEPADTIIVVTTSIENYKKIIKQDNCMEFVENKSFICIDEEAEKSFKIS